MMKTTPEKIRVGNLEISAILWEDGNWCVQVKGPKEGIRFFLPGRDEIKANSMAQILADLIRNSVESDCSR